jgi:hypothetical protein
MDIVIFLEELASKLHYSSEFRTLIDQQSQPIKNAFYHKDIEELKMQFLNVGYLATPSDVVQM